MPGRIQTAPRQSQGMPGHFRFLFRGGGGGGGGSGGIGFPYLGITIKSRLYM